VLIFDHISIQGSHKLRLRSGTGPLGFR